MPLPAPFTVRAGGASLAARRWPGDGPRVVFLHAGVADQRSWYAVIDTLAETGADSAGGGIDSTAYDRRGCGASAVSDTDFRHVDDLAEVVTAIGGGPVILVGNSMGGALALDYALEAPADVAAMLLIAPAISGAPEFDSVDASTMVLSDRIDRAWTDGDTELLVRLETWLWLDGPGQPEGRVSAAPRRLAEEMNRQIASLAAPEGSGASGIDAWSRLGEIAAPTIVVAGELDIPVMVERSRNLSGQLADAVFRPLPGTAHLPSLEVPEVIAGLVGEIADRVR
jgi:pimeloyl-ACP methyl ester carboxylesterase